MKELSGYNVTLEELKAVIEAFNASDKKSVTLPLDGSGEELLCMFLAGMHSVSTDNTAQLPEVCKEFYKNLPEDLFDDVTTEMEADALTRAKELAEAAPEEVQGEEPAAEEGSDPNATEFVSECPTFGAQNLTEPDCQDCKVEHPEEFEACAAKTEAAATKEPKKRGRKKGSKNAAPKEPKEPKAKKERKPRTPKDPNAPPKEKVLRKRSRYGHIVGSMSGDIDNAVWQGGHIDVLTAWLANRHNRELSAARSKIRGHVNHLVQNKAVVVTEVEGVLKAQLEFAPGFTAENTECETVELPAYVAPPAAPVQVEEAPADTAAPKNTEAE